MIKKKKQQGLTVTVKTEGVLGEQQAEQPAPQTPPPDAEEQHQHCLAMYVGAILLSLGALYPR